MSNNAGRSSNCSQAGIALLELAISLIFIIIPLQVGITLSTSLHQRATILESIRAAGRLAGHATPASGDPALEICEMARSSAEYLLNRASIAADIEIESLDLNSSRALASMRRVEAMRITVTPRGNGLGWRLLQGIGYTPVMSGEFLIESGIRVTESTASTSDNC